MANVLFYYSDLILLISLSILVDAIFTDIWKKFHSVDPSILVKKFKYNIIVRQMLNWIKSYLINRTQQINLSNFVLLNLNVTSGILQGGHL